MPAEQPLIAKSGWWLIGACVSIAAILWVNVSPVTVLPFIPVLVWLFLVYRDPYRDIPSSPLGIISPVDGEVVSVLEGQDPYCERQSGRATIIELRSSWVASYSLRSPTEGEMKFVKCDTSRKCWKVVTDEGDHVVISVQGGISIGRGASSVMFGHRVGQGQRCGSTPAAATVHIYLETSARIDIQPGDRVVAGETVLATLKHH